MPKSPPTIDSSRRGCDICRSLRRQVLHEQRFVTFDDGTGLLGGYDVVACDVCGFVYADGIPKQSVFERYYRDMSKHEPKAERNHRRSPDRDHATDLVALEVARRLPDRAARILDVGVGNGGTLRALKRLGYTDLTGLDPSPRTVKVIRAKHKLRVLHTPISQMACSEERFDVILLSGVLEHLRDLRPTLWLLKALLREKGRMCIAVPDAARFAESVESPYQYLSVEHINFFTAQSLESLFFAVGMTQESQWTSTALLGALKEPIVQAIFEAGDSSRQAIVQNRRPYDYRGKEEMARYLALSGRLQDRVTTTFDAFVRTGEAVIVWGAGSLTMNLLSTARFSQLNIVAFVDANPNYWDKCIRGIPVIAPTAVRHLAETILVVSYAYQNEICQQIRSEYRLDNRVVPLFATTQAPGDAESIQIQYG